MTDMFSPFTPPRLGRRAPLRSSVALLVVFGLLCHGLLLLDDALFADDWVMFFADSLSPGSHLTAEHDLLLGRPFSALFYWLTADAGLSLTGFRVLALGCILANAIVVFALCARVFPRQSLAPLLIALFYLAYPGSKVLHWNSTIIYTVSLTLFLLGFFCIFHSLDRKRLAALWRLAGFALLFCSFDTRSMLVFYYFFIALFAVLQARQRQPKDVRRWRRFAAYAFYALFPALFWMAMDLFFPKPGRHSGYNEVTLSLGIVSTYVVFLYTIVKQLSHALLVWFRHDLLAIPVFLLLGVWAGVRNARPPRVDLPEPYWRSVLAAVVLLGMAIAPYAAAQRFPTMNDFYSRHLLLVNLPLAALFTLGLCGCFTDERRRMTAGGILVTVGFLATFACYGIVNQVRVQANWVKNLGLAQAIRARVDTTPWTYFLIDLQDDSPSYTLPPIRCYELSGLFRMVWGQAGKTGVLNRNPDREAYGDSRPRDRQALQDQLTDYIREESPRFLLLDGFNPDGAALSLTVRPALQPSDLELALRYWHFTLSGAPGRDAWLAGLWRVTLDTPPSPGDAAPARRPDGSGDDAHPAPPDAR